MTVELFGPARALVGRPTIELTIVGETTLAAFGRALAAAFPVLVGAVVRTDGTFIEPNYVLLDGSRAVTPATPFAAADRPCVLFLASGG